MASLDTGSVGIKLLAGLPDGNALPTYAAELLDDPHDVYALVRLRPSHKVDRFEEDTHTVVMRLVELEVVDGDAADATRKQMERLRADRTGVVPLPGVDGVEVPAVGDEPQDADEPSPPTDLPVGPEWGDGEVPAEAEASTSATKQSAVPPPGFTPPTPIGTAAGKGRRSSKAQ